MSQPTFHYERSPMTPESHREKLQAIVDVVEKWELYQRYQAAIEKAPAFKTLLQTWMEAALPPGKSFDAYAHYAYAMVDSFALHPDIKLWAMAVEAAKRALAAMDSAPAEESIELENIWVPDPEFDAIGGING